MIPAVIIIVGAIFSGFSVQSQESKVKELLAERTTILQDAHYKKAEKTGVIKRLSKIETYPLLSKDIQGLEEIADACQMDIVKSMEIKKVENKMKMFNIVSFDVSIDWSMSGLSGDYMTDGEYSVILKTDGEDYKLSEFNIK